MNRFDYSSGLKPPQEISDVTGKIVKFHIPGSGGCYLGVAQIDDDVNLTSNMRLGKTDFFHYEQIHCNHIDWKTNEIKWHGKHIGLLLEGRDMGGGYMVDPDMIRQHNNDVGSLDLYYSKKYPTSQ